MEWKIILLWKFKKLSGFQTKEDQIDRFEVTW